MMRFGVAAKHKSKKLTVQAKPWTSGRKQFRIQEDRAQRGQCGKEEEMCALLLLLS
jgi:hypothetical protein